MEVTRRFWGVVGVGLALAAGGVLLERPSLLVGGAAVGAWLLTAQYLFVAALRETDATLDVDQSVVPATVAVDGTATVTVTATLGTAVPLDLRVRARPPAGVEAGDRGEQTCVLRQGETAATFDATCPVAGAHTFAEPVLEARDRRGLFAETLHRGPARRVAVEPRSASEVHVGRGGEGIAVAYGSHPSDRPGGGDESAGVREYVTGDAANRIDWKATARLGEPYVREFETETDLPTTLVVDHRASLGTGPAEETGLDALREVALSVLAAAEAAGDPVSLLTVGDGAITGRVERTVTDAGYVTVRDRLRVLAPTEAVERDGGIATGPAAARRAADGLDGDDALARTLRPYLAPAAYVDRVEDDPLFAAIRSDRRVRQGRTVVFTDDAHPAELREAVKLAREQGRVVVFLAPRALFEPGGLADLEAAYDRYREFERLRRSLAELGRVEVYEVAPADRIDAVRTASAVDRQD